MKNKMAQLSLFKRVNYHRNIILIDVNEKYKEPREAPPALLRGNPEVSETTIIIFYPNIPKVWKN
jgi:hypothetical protein